MIVKDIDLLPTELREKSLSDREIVLPYQEALQALDVLVEAKWALLGWEGWVQYADGRRGPAAPIVIGTTAIGQEPEEDWETYVQRSSDFCRETIETEQKLWDTDPKHTSVKLYFCLTALSRAMA